MRVNNMSNREIQELLNFMDEFAWLSSKYKASDIKNFRNILLENIDERNMRAHSTRKFDDYSDKSTSKNYLIGVLPKFFQDKDLFEKNSDLAEFAECIGVYLPRYDKKSRYEMIGTIICTISEMNEMHLNQFVNAINKLVSDEMLMIDLKNYKYSKGSAYSWNEIIRQLSDI